MNYLEKIEELIKHQNGTILSADLDKYGIPRKYLQILIAEGRLEKYDRGIYVAVDAIEDEMFARQKKYSKLIYSHETALFMHDLSDRTPFEYSATVPSGYKVVSNVADRFKIYYVKKELHELGVISLNSSFGNQIRVYNIERTICDIIKSRSRVDVQILNEALKRYVRIKSSDYSLLMDYAKKLNIETVLKNYLEVIL
ncbi:MAG TPA: type IV toxin-antitoxin system AbiEi family antitoxin domain-containing protein [Atribacterota bacterium]|nr:type IV toxin-antitoxin system AbiEi family antitoxin domain-containing protein [Atribacterota bacterium]